MTCDVKTLMAQARCYQCMPPSIRKGLIISLLCQWSNANKSTVFSYEPSSAIIKWTDSGGVHTGDLSNFYSVTSVTGVATVTDVLLANKGLTAISGISALSGLITINVQDNPALDVIDFSNCPTINNILVSNDGITSLDLSDCTAIVSVQCDGCLALSSLNVQNRTHLTILNCSGCNLTSLPLTGCTALTILDCSMCVMNQMAVDSVLCQTDSNGAINGNLNISSNSVPSVAGLACSASLDPGKGWTVTHD